MKSETNKKMGLAASLAALVWLPLKTIGWSSTWSTIGFWSNFGDWIRMVWVSVYWVPKEYEKPNQNLLDSLKIVDFVLIFITFIFWIISFFKIRKIEDKELKDKKIKRTLWLIFVLIIITTRDMV